MSLGPLHSALLDAERECDRARANVQRARQLRLKRRKLVAELIDLAIFDAAPAWRRDHLHPRDERRKYA